jgi:hypothetical protein
MSIFVLGVAFTLVSSLVPTLAPCFMPSLAPSLAPRVALEIVSSFKFEGKICVYFSTYCNIH